MNVLRIKIEKLKRRNWFLLRGMWELAQLRAVRNVEWTSKSLIIFGKFWFSEWKNFRNLMILWNGKFWKFFKLPDWNILEICWSYKLESFGNLLIFQFGKVYKFSNSTISKIIKVSVLTNSWNNQIYVIVQKIGRSTNLKNLPIFGV